MALDSVINSVYHDIKVLQEVFSPDGVMALTSVTKVPLTLFLMTLDSVTNNIYYDIKMALKVFSYDGVVTLASIYRRTSIDRCTDINDTCSKCHKTKKCH